MFEGKAEEVLGGQLEKAPTHVKLEKLLGRSHTKVNLEGPEIGGGMMLYTSGTTARPVCPPFLTRQIG